MRSSMTRNLSQKLRMIAIALGMAVMTASVVVTPARADSDDWRHGRDGDNLRRDRDRERERHDRDWREHRAGIYYSPGYIYAPPPVIYAPPPPPAGLNIIVPLDIH